MFQMISMWQLEQLLEQGKEMVLLDVRAGDEYGAGHLTGAISVPLEDLEAWRSREEALGEIGRRRGKYARGAPLIVYCAHGSKSLLAARILDGWGIPVIAAAGGLAGYRGRFYVDRHL